MTEYEQYQFTDDNRIIPIQNMGWVKNEPKTQNFDDALKIFLEATGFKDARLADDDSKWEEFVKTDIPNIYSAYYIDPEEALFVLTGIRPSDASYFVCTDSTFSFPVEGFGLFHYAT